MPRLFKIKTKDIQGYSNKQLQQFVIKHYPSHASRSTEPVLSIFKRNIAELDPKSESFNAQFDKLVIGYVIYSLTDSSEFADEYPYTLGEIRAMKADDFGDTTENVKELLLFIGEQVLLEKKLPFTFAHRELHTPGKSPFKKLLDLIMSHYQKDHTEAASLIANAQ